MPKYKIYIYNIIIHNRTLFQYNRYTIIYLHLISSIQNFISFLYGIIYGELNYLALLKLIEY